MLTSAFTVRVNLIGAELRRYRSAAGLTLRQVQDRLGIHPTLLNRMELGGRPQSSDDVAGLLAIYGVMGEERRQLLELTREAERTTLLQRHSALLAQRTAALKVLESQATRLINFECQLVPGLLQTVPYAQALIRHVGMINDEKVIDERVTTRIHRQGVLRKHRAPQFQAIITENVLHNVIGDTAVMHEQLVYLTEVAERPNVNLRITFRDSKSALKDSFETFSVPKESFMALRGALLVQRAALDGQRHSHNRDS
jgi:transcriptional regulator with XRE-family HTH domain